MYQLLRPAAVLLALFTLLTGVLYPVAVTLMAQAAFPAQANGSLIPTERGPVGSALIGQRFQDPRYFWGRPSATMPHPYNAQASNGSNLGPTNPALRNAVAERIASLRSLDPSAPGAVPADLVTASGSGLDPHLSPAAALFQVQRVARARALPERRVRELVNSHLEPRTLGILGEPRLNVLSLNLDLDQLSRVSPAAK